MLEIFILLTAFQVKHFICDYPLQTEYMLGKFKDVGWVLPLQQHCFVHAIGTLLICLFATDNQVLIMTLPLLDFVLHFTMDRVKASSKMLGRFKIENKFFWWSLGFDQMFHHLTHYLIIFIILK